MLQLAKRAVAICVALLLILTAVPLSAFRVHAEEEEPAALVQHTLDFTKMPSVGEGSGRKPEDKEANTKKNKEKVRNMVLEAGAVECENMFLKGNWETIINPGGFNKQGYYVQKVTAEEGDTVENATVSLRYWICNNDTGFDDAEQGYIEVYVSTDNVNYELVWEDREGHGASFTYIPQEVTIELPVVEGQTEVYVKYVMEHWNTYEGAGISYSTLTINSIERPVESDKQPHECTMVTGDFNFNTLTQGEVSAEDIGAVNATNMFFGMDEVPLLSPRNGYESANATWMVRAAEGEPLHDCVVTITGRTWWLTESMKDQNYLKVFASVDGINFTQVTEFRSTDVEDDTQRFTVDVTEVVKGYAKAYIKLEWMVYDSPHIFGIRGVKIVGNTTGVDPSGENNRMVVSNVQCFSTLPVGKADKDAVGAFKSANLMFGYDKTPLLTVSEAGEDAYATWKLTAPEGETFANMYLTLVGKVGVVHADKKDTTKMTVSISVDEGETYSKVLELTPGEDQSDTQQAVLDLSVQTAGLSEVLVKVYWSTEDDPSCMGLRAMALVANAGAAYPDFTPALVDRVITDEEMNAIAPSEPDPTEPTQPSGGDQNEPANNQWIIYVVIGVVVAAVVVLVIVKAASKKKTKE